MTSQLSPDPGSYVWLCLVEQCTFHDGETDKPYMLWAVKVEGGEQDGFDFSFKVYHSERAKKWCTFALKKFGYPPELLDCEHPILRRKEIVGKRGKVLVEVTTDNEGAVSFDIKAFAREHEMDLEEKLRKMRGEQMDLPEMDVNRPIEGPATPSVAETFHPPQPTPEPEPTPAEEEARKLEANLAYLDTIYLHGHDPEMDLGW